MHLHPDTATPSLKMQTRRLCAVRRGSGIEPRHELPIDVSVAAQRQESVSCDTGSQQQPAAAASSNKRTGRPSTNPACCTSAGAFANARFCCAQVAGALQHVGVRRPTHFLRAFPHNARQRRFPRLALAAPTRQCVCRDISVRAALLDKYTLRRGGSLTCIAQNYAAVRRQHF